MSNESTTNTPTLEDVLYDRALNYANKVRKATKGILTSTDIASGYVAGWDDACNSHATLVAALEDIVASWPAHGTMTQNKMADAMAAKARIAIRAAKGEV